MSDYTPTTSYVRSIFAGQNEGILDLHRQTGFDRWLAEVKADAWEEGVAAHRIYDYPENPYRGENK